MNQAIGNFSLSPNLDKAVGLKSLSVINHFSSLPIQDKFVQVKYTNNEAQLDMGLLLVLLIVLSGMVGRYADH